MSSVQRVPFPVVIGCARSGTTLLRAMLDSHPDLAIPNESQFLGVLARHPARFEGASGLDVDGLTSFLRSDVRFSVWGIDVERATDVVRSAAPESVASAVRILYAQYAVERNKPRAGDKTPSLVFHVQSVAQLLPEARFVHLVRDGRDVALSWLEGDWAASSITHAADQWRLRVVRARSDGERLGPDRYREIFYEDLVTKPDTVLRDLCAWVDLSFDPEMLRYHVRRGREIADGMLRPEYHEHLDRPPTPGLRDWRRDMSRQDVAEFELVVGSTLAAFGYELADVPAPLGVRVRSAGRRVAWGGHRVRKWIGRRTARRRLP